MNTTQTLGFPRIGTNREMKRALEAYWKGKLDGDALLATFAEVTREGWRTQMAHYRFPDTKLAQDIISTLQITGGWLRRRFFNDVGDDKRTNSFAIALETMDRHQRLHERNYGRWN